MGSKILIVDDSQMMNQMIRDILGAAGYETRSALSGSQALDQIQTWPPDLVLLDVMMPDMDGFEVCRRLRQMVSTRAVPIIMVTAKASIEDKQRGYEAGADDYITKPFEPIELKLRLSAMLKRAQLKRSGKSEKKHQVFAVHSLRGGSGNTSLAVNIAVGLQQLWDKPVVLVDLVRPLGVCCSMLNLQPVHRVDTIVNQSMAALDQEKTASLLSTHESGLKLLGGFSDPAQAEKLNENMVSHLLAQLIEQFSFVVIDTSHDFTSPTTAVLNQAQQIIMPVTPDINAARLAQIELNTLESFGYQKKPFLILNWTFAKQGIQQAQLESYLGQKFNHVIPYSPGLWSKAINTGIPVIASEPEKAEVHLLEDLVWKLSSPECPDEKPERPTSMWTRIQKRQPA